MCIMQGPWQVADILKGAAFTDPDQPGDRPGPRPASDGKTGSPVGGHNWVVNVDVGKDADKAAAVASFLTYMTAPEQQAVLAKSLGLLPTNTRRVCRRRRGERSAHQPVERRPGGGHQPLRRARRFRHLRLVHQELPEHDHRRPDTAGRPRCHAPTPGRRSCSRTRWHSRVSVWRRVRAVGFGRRHLHHPPGPDCREGSACALGVWIAWAFMAPVLLVMALIVFYPARRRRVSRPSPTSTATNQGTRFKPPILGVRRPPELHRDPDRPGYRSSIRSSSGRSSGPSSTCSSTTRSGSALALALNQKFRGRTTYRMLLLLPWAVPGLHHGHRLAVHLQRRVRAAQQHPRRLRHPEGGLAVDLARGTTSCRSS